MGTTNRKTNFYLIPLAIVLAGAVIAGGLLLRGKKAGAPAGSELDYQPTANSFAPPFTLKTPAGNPISLGDLKSQNALLVFWSTTCEYCAKELEDLKKFTDAYRGKIAVIAIVYKEGAAGANEYQKKENINFTLLVDSDGRVAEKYLVAGTPSHFFINRQGKIISVAPDYQSFDSLVFFAREMFNNNAN